MRVISEGTPPSKMYYNFKCLCCKSIIEIQGKDCTVSEDGYGGAYIEVKVCPVCKSSNNGMCELIFRWDAKFEQTESDKQIARVCFAIVILGLFALTLV